MGELGFNKIFGAVLATFLFIFGLNEVATRMFGGGGHHGDHHYETDQEWAEASFKGWSDVVAVSATSGAAVEEAVFDLGQALASADAAAGQTVLERQCASCHSWNEGGANGTGPNLHGVIGRPIAAASTGFGYSAALSGKGGQWSYEDMNAWLTNPGGYARGTSMAYAGLRSPRRDNDRMNVIAYLASNASNAPAFPAPLTTEDAAEIIAEEIVETVQEAADTVTDAGSELVEDASDAVETATEAGNALLDKAKEDAKEITKDATDGEH